jgi:hypothetical protein
MPRKKIASSNVVLYAGPSPATGSHTTSNIKEIYGTQSFGYNFATSKEDILVFGKRAADRREDPSAPVVTFDLSYYLSNFDNEKSFGFVTNSTTSGAFSNLLDGTKDERNIFAMISPDGIDAIGAVPGSTPCIGFGNATIASYNFNAAVGSYPTVSMSFEAIDAEYYVDSTAERLPAINVDTGAIATGTFTLPTASGNAFGGRDPILRPRDISVNLSGASGVFYDLANACVQSVDIGVEFGRQQQQCLGAFYRKDSIIADVIPVTFAVEFLAKDMTAGRLSTFACETGAYSVDVTIRRPNCSGTGAIASLFRLKNLSYESQAHDFSIGGDASTVTMNFQGTVGGGNDSLNGLFMSGIANT